MRKLLSIVVVLVVSVVAVGCGEIETTSGAGKTATTQDEQTAERAAQREHRAEARRARERAQRRKAQTRAARSAEAQPTAPVPSEPPPVESEPVANCDVNYEGVCLDPDASDYDCESGSGDGPMYTGYVRVVGSDPHGLDSDGDGHACE